MLMEEASNTPKDLNHSQEIKHCICYKEMKCDNEESS